MASWPEIRNRVRHRRMISIRYCVLNLAIAHARMSGLTEDDYEDDSSQTSVPFPSVDDSIR